MAEVGILFFKEHSEHLWNHSSSSDWKVGVTLWRKQQKIERYPSAGEACIGQPFQDFSAA